MPHQAVLLHQGLLASLQQLRANPCEHSSFVAVDTKLDALLKLQHEQPVWPRSVLEAASE
jgi:hypothetical protein